MRFVQSTIDQRRWIDHGLITCVVVCALICAADSSQIARMTIEGSVRTAAGDPVPEALVVLQQDGGGKAIEKKADTRGVFGFAISQPGTYVVVAKKPGFRTGEPQSISAQKSTNHIDLVLTPVQSDSAKMEFDDKPNFSIAGVTDWSGAGGHGSETGLRTTEALTRQTVALNSVSGEKELPSALSDQMTRALRDQRQQLQKKLAMDNRPELHRDLGDIDERLNDPVAAEHEYEEAARLDPSEGNYFTWGTELLLHRASAAAVEVFSKGVATHTKSARMVAGLGAALYASGSIDQAVQRICEASEMEPARVEFYKLMAEMEQTATSAPSCILRSLSQFLALQPRSPLANYYYAMALWKQQRAASTSASSQEAEKLLEKAIQLDSHFGQAYLLLGIIHADTGQPASAIKDFQSCISVEPKLSECHYRLGLGYRRIGEEQKAKEEIQKYEQAQATETAEIERQRSNLRQFLVVLKDQPSSIR